VTRAWIGALVALGFAGGPASAATPAITLNPGSGTPGSTVAIRGSGFCGTAGCSTVSVFFAGMPAASGLRVAANGTFAGSFRVPGGGTAGTQNVAATQTLADGNELRAFAHYELIFGKGEEAERQAEANDLAAKSPDALVSEGQPHGVPLASFAAGSTAPGAPAGSSLSSPPAGAAAGEPARSASRLPLLALCGVLAGGAATALWWWLRRPLARA
jgi:hypothetical protein